jgi:hypothetical protein
MVSSVNRLKLPMSYLWGVYVTRMVLMSRIVCQEDVTALTHARRML